MTPRLLVAGLVFTFGLALPGTAAEQKQTPKQHPNVILILADDLGARDLGCTGSTFYETPNLDRLAREGMLFTQAYAACPVCSPTRAALMTGKYPPRTGITNFIGGSRKGKLLPAPYAHELALSEVTLAEALKDGGYVTGMAGKWHLGGAAFGPDQQGFDESANADTKSWNGQVERADRVTDFALKFIEANRAKPFFLYLPHNLVHIPLKSKDKLIAKYQAKAAALPSGDDPNFRPDGSWKDRQVQSHPVYAAMMEDLDSSVGRALAKVDELGLKDRTIVIFTSDNGGLSTAEGSPTSNAPLRTGKGWLYEGGVRVPLIVRWPGVTKPGSTTATPVITVDIYPTLLEAAGIAKKTEVKLDGESLVPVLKGGTLPERPLYWHYPHYSNQGGGPGSAMRLGDWKLVEWFESGRAELYNLAQDPSERNDLARENPDKLHALQKLLESWRREVGAKMPQPNPDFEEK